VIDTGRIWGDPNRTESFPAVPRAEGDILPIRQLELENVTFVLASSARSKVGTGEGVRCIVITAVTAVDVIDCLTNDTYVAGIMCASEASREEKVLSMPGDDVSTEYGTSSTELP